MLFNFKRSTYIATTISILNNIIILGSESFPSYVIKIKLDNLTACKSFPV